VDNSQVGKLIRGLRAEKGMTQRQLAEQMGITEQAVSKWERGLGGPEISLLPALSSILGVNIEKILAGELQPNDNDRGNMKRIKFYVCPDCGGILTSTGEAEISCCGRKLNALKAEKGNENHMMNIQKVEDDYYVTVDHEMSKEHYISFVAYVGYDRVLLVRLYPQQNAEVRFPQMQGSKIFAYCNRHGLWEKGS
jgi:transcriptional regulator with XRE-family HTH domain/desulfoferrodoxin (superoxide reductase-like protein)